MDETVINAEGFTLGYTSLGVFRVISPTTGEIRPKLLGEFPDHRTDSELVRVQVGPGYAEFRRSQCRRIEMVPGFGLVACIHRTEQPVTEVNPFALGYAAVERPFARAVDAAIG